MTRVLVVDDEETICWALKSALIRLGHSVSIASSAEEGFRLAEKDRPDVVVLDVRLPGLDGLSSMEQFQEITNDAPVIVVTAFVNLSTAMRAVEGGAFDYLAKPFDLDQVLETITRALKHRSLQNHPSQPAAIDVLETSEEFIGTSTSMQAVFNRIALTRLSPLL
jgi:two-component system, NtrC family, nitrogen regulation response regulator GlnG